MSQALELYRYQQCKIAECAGEIVEQLGSFEDRSNGRAPAANRKRRKKNALWP